MCELLSEWHSSADAFEAGSSVICFYFRGIVCHARNTLVPIKGKCLFYFLPPRLSVSGFNNKCTRNEMGTICQLYVHLHVIMISNGSPSDLERMCLSIINVLVPPLEIGLENVVLAHILASLSQKHTNRRKLTSA